MLTRGAKPIVGLIVLLAWPYLGLGSRVEASFSLRRTQPDSGRAIGSSGFELQLVLNDEDAATRQTSSTPGMGQEGDAAPADDLPPSRSPQFPNGIFPLFADSFNGGGTSAGTTSAGTGSGASVFIVSLSSQVTSAELAGLLFLADERLNPPPFSSRLFRPPR